MQPIRTGCRIAMISGTSTENRRSSKFVVDEQGVPEVVSRDPDRRNGFKSKFCQTLPKPLLTRVLCLDPVENEAIFVAIISLSMQPVA